MKLTKKELEARAGFKEAFPEVAAARDKLNDVYEKVGTGRDELQRGRSNFKRGEEGH
jgi:hypothetical protein